MELHSWFLFCRSRVHNLRQISPVLPDSFLDFSQFLPVPYRMSRNHSSALMTSQFIPVISWVNERTVEEYTPSPCFTLLCSTPFCFNAHCQRNTCLIFSLTPFGWLRSVRLTQHFWWRYSSVQFVALCCSALFILPWVTYSRLLLFSFHST